MKRKQQTRVARGSWLRAYGLFTGGVIGVGVFGLPAALVAAGLPVFSLYVVLVGALVWWIHRRFLTVVLATPGRHRLPGYAHQYLGRPGYLVSAMANVLGLFGTLAAYLIAGGTFLHLLLANVVSLPPLVAVGLYLLPGAVLLLWGIRALPTIELVILVLFLSVLGVLSLVAGEAFSFSRFPFGGEVSSALLPYGVLLFSFWGVSLIPETAELSGRSERRTRSVLTAGLLTSLVTYVLFAVTVAGITGAATTEDALGGLRRVLGEGVIFFALVFGLLTTFSSYLALGLTLVKTLMLDVAVPRFPAWVVTVFVPLAFVLLGARSLLSVLAITGAVFLGVEGLTVLAMRGILARPAARSAWRPLTFQLLGAGALLVLGVAGELFRQIVS
ncbi:MAG: tyrosine-specific transport protein [Parcubacteria group bacterium Gr01-1014_38]|nr:MAG: tyrosine-specific transport protein [Parcubacteria group bacterium Gr01-1014_38]